MPSTRRPLLALSASPSPTSRTRALAAAAVDLWGAGEVIDLGTLDAEALLGRRHSPDVDAVLDKIAASSLLLLATPTYRATYAGLLKVLLDQLPQGAFAHKVVVLAGTGGSHHHFLSLDTGLRPVVASLAGVAAPTVLYGIGDDFDETPKPTEAFAATISQALSEADAIAEALASLPA
jgi:FMN reductase